MVAKLMGSHVGRSVGRAHTCRAVRVAAHNNTVCTTSNVVLTALRMTPMKSRPSLKRIERTQGLCEYREFI
jgi:hypothetical protein